MQTRTDLINFLIKKHGYKRYLEIGVQNTAQNFDKIYVEYKVCVDPDPKAKANYCLKSDEFFDNCHDTFMEGIKFDIIFIDGLHTAEQVGKDFQNSLKVLSPNGCIVLHDCNPLKYEHTIVPRPTERGHWNGDVYKVAVELARQPFRFQTVDIDNGCGVYYKSGLRTYKDVGPDVYDWDYFNENRSWMLNLVSWDEFTNLQ
jgi:hypothetical protein